MSREEVATLACGCFWCLEAVFKEVKGVQRVLSGYTGGTKVNPTYRYQLHPIPVDEAEVLLFFVKHCFRLI